MTRSDGWIIGLMFLMPPIGLYLLWRRRLIPGRPAAAASSVAVLVSVAIIVGVPILAGSRSAPASPRPLAGVATFDDEFNGTVLDNTAWVALNRPGDAGNNELECYVPSNAAVGGGNLVLTSKVDSSCTGYSYTSAMVQWRTFNFLYGTIEMRAKEAGGKGAWPALWLLGANCQQTNITTPNNVPPCNWPAPGSDEIDITEILGGNLTTVNQQLHSNGNNPGCSPTTSDVSLNWHTYTLDWQPGSLVWKIDGTTTCTVTSNVPSQPMFLIMNTALGGNGGGTIDNNTLPQTHSIDYVRVNSSGPPPLARQ